MGELAFSSNIIQAHLRIWVKFKHQESLSLHQTRLALESFPPLRAAYSFITP